MLDNNFYNNKTDVESLLVHAAEMISEVLYLM